ncbi:MAG: acyl-CoA thioesterase [Streptosporangiales bacterium]
MSPSPAEACPARVTIERRIEWPDTDAAGHFHHLTSFRLAEAAEAALFDRLGLARRVFGRTPRVRVEAVYHETLLFLDRVGVTIAVRELGRTSLRLGFEIHRGETLAAEGEVVMVLLDRAMGDPMPWPDDVRLLLLTAGPQKPERLR